MKPIINKRKCPAQKDICKAIKACPNQAIHYLVDHQERMGGIIVIDESLCSQCGLCAEECCGNAIDMV